MHHFNVYAIAQGSFRQHCTKIIRFQTFISNAELILIFMFLTILTWLINAFINACSVASLSNCLPPYNSWTRYLEMTWAKIHSHLHIPHNLDLTYLCSAASSAAYAVKLSATFLFLDCVDFSRWQESFSSPYSSQSWLDLYMFSGIFGSLRCQIVCQCADNALFAQHVVKVCLKFAGI